MCVIDYHLFLLLINVILFYVNLGDSQIRLLSPTIFELLF